MKKNYGKLNIKCEWIEKNTILVNPDGQVWPCCYIGNPNFLYETIENPDDKLVDGVIMENQLENVNKQAKYHLNNPTIKKYVDNKKEHNIFNKPLHEIVKSEWFTKTLPESWSDSDTLIHQCWRLCNKK